jgi:predicted PurR-regulated permease PerM
MTSEQFSALKRQNRLLALLLVVTLVVSLISAALSIATLLYVQNLSESLQQALSTLQEAVSRLDLDQINQTMEAISGLTDLLQRILTIFQ